MPIEKTPNSTWRARWRTADGDHRSRSFATRREAKAHLVEMEQAVQRGSYVDPRLGRLTFAAWTEEWTTTLTDLRPATLTTIDVAMRVHVNPVIGDRPLGAITTDELRRLVKGLADGVDGRRPLAPATVRNVSRHLAASLAAAVRAGRLVRSPWVSGRGGIRLPAPTKRDFTIISPDEADALAEAMPARMQALVLLAFGSGLRLGEMLGLTVGDVDALPARRGNLAAVGADAACGPGVLRVRQQMISPPSGAPLLAPLKSGASRRDVEVPAFVVGALAEHLGLFGPGPGGLVFHARSGAGLRRNDCSRAWRQARTAVGIEARGFHDLRHNYATNVLSAGVAAPTVAVMLGHSVQMLLSTYGHALPNDRERARDVIGGLYDGSGVRTVSGQGG